MKNNKGFSLVELIVVIAIMAVLVGVLAPTLLRYVEKSRIQKDASAVAEVVQAARIAVAEETVNDAVATAVGGAGGCSISLTYNSTTKAVTITCSSATALQTEITKTISGMTFSGKDAGDVTIAVTASGDGYAFSCSGGSGDWATAIGKVK